MIFDTVSMNYNLRNVRGEFLHHLSYMVAHIGRLLPVFPLMLFLTSTTSSIPSTALALCPVVFFQLPYCLLPLLPAECHPFCSHVYSNIFFFVWLILLCLGWFFSWLLRFSFLILLRNVFPCMVLIIFISAVDIICLATAVSGLASAAYVMTGRTIV